MCSCLMGSIELIRSCCRRKERPVKHIVGFGGPSERLPAWAVGCPPCAGLTSHAAQAHWLVLEQELIEINKDIKLCENCMRYVHPSLAAAVQIRIRPMMRRKYGEPFTHPLNHLKACSIDRTALHIGRHCIACTELFPREEYTMVCFSADACAHSMFGFRDLHSLRAQSFRNVDLHRS